MNHFEINWQSADGLKIYAQGWEPDIGSNNNPTPIKGVVCLVHGIGEHTSRFAHVADYLVKEGYVFFGADWRGHGRSEGQRGHIPSIEALAKDIDTLLDKAKQRYPNKPLFLYGQSLGAIMVLYYGLKRKPHINGIIASSPALHTSLDEQPLKIMAAKVLGSILPRLSLHSGVSPLLMSRDNDVVKRYIHDPMVHYRITLGFGKIMIGVRKWVLENAASFPLPLLLMHGKEDLLAYPSGSIQFAGPIDEKCQLVLWENAFHELHNEPEKIEVLNTITHFLNKLVQ